MGRDGRDGIERLYYVKDLLLECASEGGLFFQNRFVGVKWASEYVVLPGCNVNTAMIAAISNKRNGNELDMTVKHAPGVEGQRAVVRE